MIEECKQLKSAVVEHREIEQRLQERTVVLHTDLNAIQEDLKAARERISELNASVVTEHEEGFYKALRQIYRYYM